MEVFSGAVASVFKCILREFERGLYRNSGWFTAEECSCILFGLHVASIFNSFRIRVLLFPLSAKAAMV